MRTLFLAAAFFAGGMALPAEADQTGAKNDSASGAWGPVPPPTDSTRAAYRTRSRSAWEYPVLVPYQIVNLPLRYSLAGFKSGVIWLDDVGFIPLVRRVFGAQELPYGVLANFSISPLSGVGAGATFYHDEFFGPRNRAKLRTHFSTEGTRRVALGMVLNEDGKVEFEAGGGYRLRPEARFSGIGPQASDANESHYTQETSWGGLTLSRAASHDLSLTAGVIVSGVGTRGPRDEGSGSDDRTLLEVFGGDDRPAGYGDRSDGVMYSAGLAHDDTRKVGRPERGGVRMFKAAYFSGFEEEDGSFYSYRADLQQFLPLWFQERALALRGVIHWIENDGDSDVPFQRLLTNDEPDLMRGFRDLRWRDRGITILTAEYRFPLWAYNRHNGRGIDFYMFTDVGQVFEDFDDISKRNMRASYGAGLRFMKLRGFVGRLEFGYSEEDTVWRLAAEQTFQYSKGGLYNGRDKSVLR
ncbi:MAG: BamA/TamA family outer membrane protein [Gemmatimonadetes bacterium]|nr:BamA/TamA family outer membrane protein [Gemmatimonadota bacterium]